uniref:Macrophage migration inhibitory factor n=1 Tax=Ornithorhynchus anatinus TaxID=9258 RepID=A0A6I8NH82_ORNAN
MRSSAPSWGGWVWGLGLLPCTWGYAPSACRLRPERGTAWAGRGPGRPPLLTPAGLPFLPPQYIAVHISPDQLMAFGGTSDPCALCSLHSIGKIGGPQNKTYSKLLCGLLTKHLNIPADRVYINYYDMNAANVGWNGSTFA